MNFVNLRIYVLFNFCFWLFFYFCHLVIFCSFIHFMHVKNTSWPRTQSTQHVYNFFRMTHFNLNPIDLLWTQPNTTCLLGINTNLVIHILQVTWGVYITLVFTICWVWIILSQILSIPNNNHAQKHKYLHGKTFLLKGKKPRDKFRINFTILKSITISLVFYVFLGLLTEKNLTFIVMMISLMNFEFCKLKNLCII